MGEEKKQYGGDVVMFLLNKIIKNVGLAHGFKTINHVVLKPCAHGLHMVFMHMVLKPCTYVINVGQKKKKT